MSPWFAAVPGVQLVTTPCPLFVDFVEAGVTGGDALLRAAQDYLLPLSRAMQPGAEFRVATDIPDYVRQTLDEVPQAGFDLVAQGSEPWEDWLSTRYEQKALREGRDPHYLTFRRA